MAGALEETQDDEGPVDQPSAAADPSTLDDSQDESGNSPIGGGGALGMFGSLTDAQRASMAKEAMELRGEAGQGYTSALQAQQERANAIRDALRQTRERLVNEHPDKTAMWMAVSSALGAPIPAGGGLAASLTQGAAASVPFLQQFGQQAEARKALIDRYGQAIAGYGPADQPATSPDIIGAQLGLANLKLRQAGQLDVGAMRSGRANPNAGQTMLGKLLTEQAALPPGDPRQALYTRQIALLQKNAGGGGTGMLPGDPTKTGEEYLATIPLDMQGQVRAYAEGRMALPPRWNKDPRYQQIMAALQQYDPSYDFANPQSRVALRKSFTSGQDASNIQAIGTAIHHLNSLQQSYAQLGNSPYEWANYVSNATKGFFGNPKTQAGVSGVASNAIAVSHELATVFRKSGMSEGEINDWQKLISTSASPASSQAVIDKALELMDGRLYETAEKYNRGMGTTKDPLELLAPADQALYAKLKGGPPPEQTTVPGMGRAAGAAPGATGRWSPPTGKPGSVGPVDLATRANSYLPPAPGG